MTLLKTMLERLRRPKTLLSLIAQIVSILVLLGVKMDESLVVAVAAGICSVLATLGILTHPDRASEPWDEMLLCAACGRMEPHVMVNGRMVCKTCGTVYAEVPEESSLDAEEASSGKG